MKELSSYIVEKFKINKDTKGEGPKIVNLSDKYSVGDICLKIVQAGIQSQSRVYIDVVKITDVSKTKIIYEYVTTINDHGTRFMEMKKNEVSKIAENNYFHSSGRSSTTILVTREDSIRILKKIKEDNYKFDLYNSLNVNGRKNLDLVPVMQVKPRKEAWEGYDAFEPLTDESYNKLLKAYEKS